MRITQTGPKKLKMSFGLNQQLKYIMTIVTLLKIYFKNVFEDLHQRLYLLSVGTIFLCIDQ